MKKKLIFLIIILFLVGLVLAADSPYARRIRPVAGFPVTCVENEVAYDLVTNSFGGCDDSLTYKSFLTGTINTLLPSQTGNNGRYLTTNGTVASWGTVSAGVTANSTTGSIPYLSASNIFSDSPIIRIDANTIGQYNSTNSQVLQIYGSRTDASTYTRLQLTVANSGATTIQNIDSAGGFPAINLVSRGALNFGTADGVVWHINNSANFYPEYDNSLDIGLDSNKIRTGYFGTSVISPLYKVGASSGITANGTACTITEIKGGIITAATCTP